MSTGFQVLKRKRAVTADLASQYREVPVSTVSDSMHRLTAAGANLRPMHSAGVMAGPAITVRTRPGDNLMVHLALDVAEPGDVVVVDANGDLTNAIIGELMVMHAAKRGLAGIVIHGAIRDSAAIRGQDLPVYAAGITHRGPYKDGPGEINVPISLNGMTINPGDLIIGDEDGVLAVPYDDAEALLEAATAKNAKELEAAARFQAGTSDRTPIRARAEKLGAYFEA
ncbi:RraA family protein [Arthrobacter nitrophenolicus]|uniref:Putative 4-hydroxy-4-methyl-2-oxoglutarate aldolase n=1 Tax=Arthrobacter nitrophenolicus TaxID=683150 RepID=A0A4R5Y5B8_9MICC|nr:RraA family protein [Arthrobacter nitrophenolicus]TDL39693.1 RraA family protein [Arthrobacter nitrophenolicus]